MEIKNRTVLGELDKLIRLFVNHNITQRLSFYYLEIEQDDFVQEIYFWSASIWEAALAQLREEVWKQFGVEIGVDTRRYSNQILLQPRYRVVERAGVGRTEGGDFSSAERLRIWEVIGEQLRGIPELAGWDIQV